MIPKVSTAVSKHGNQSAMSGHSSSMAGSSGSGSHSSSASSTSTSSGCTRQKGSIQLGFYDIDRTIGKGNFATVKLARHRITKSRVALKIINKKQLDESDLQKTYREINILKKLNHVNIVRLYQVMASNNMLYLVTEHASNGELFEFLAEHGRMEEPEAQRIFWQIVLAVEYCHKQGVVHRDLKVENLLFDAYWDIKIADFGFSNTYVPGKLLDTWCGSPPYAAPEIFQGLNYNGEKLDIWSMGVILYVLVCGCLPFDGDSLQELRSRVLSGRYRIPYFLSRNCESLIQKILVLDPVKRYTVEQIKQHVWMFRDSEDDIYNGCGTSSTRGGNILPLDENVLQTMKSLGLDQDKTNASLLEQKYDNYYAIYLLLLEKFENLGPISLNIKQPSAPQNLSSSYDSVSISSSTSLEQRCESSVDRGLLRQKSCSPKGSIGTPSIDEGFSSDVSFDADQSIGKESSMEQMTPIKEDPETELQRLNSSSPTAPSNRDSKALPDFEISWQSHQFSNVKLPSQPPAMFVTPEQLTSGTTNSITTSGLANTGNLTTSTLLHSSYDEVSGERMLVNLGGHSNFSSIESQCSEYSSNISLDASQQLHSSAGNKFTTSNSFSQQVFVQRPPLVHQQRIGDCFSSPATSIAGAGFLACGRRASESNLNEQDQDELEPNPKNMKHQVKPYTIQTLSYLETSNCDPKATASKLLSPHSKLTVTQGKSNSLNVAVVSSAPGSPAVPTKRLIKQRPMTPKLSPGDHRLNPPGRTLQPPNVATFNPSQLPGTGHTITQQFLSPLAISHENFNQSQYQNINATPRAQVQTLAGTTCRSEFSGFVFVGSTKSSLLPKPHSFDETQSHNRMACSSGSTGDALGFAANSLLSNEEPFVCRRQHSFDTPSKLHNQSSTEDQSGDDNAQVPSLVTSPATRLKSQRTSPYCVKQSVSAGGSPARGAFSRRNTFQRQVTLRPQNKLERQASKCSASPPRGQMTHHSSLENSAQNAIGGNTVQSLALSPGVSTSNVGNADLTCMLQQMELRNSCVSPQLHPANSSSNLSESFPPPVHLHPAPQNVQTSGYRFAFSSSQPRPEISPPIPSISFESADGVVCYLENSGESSVPNPGSLASSASYSLMCTDSNSYINLQNICESSAGLSHPVMIQCQSMSGDRHVPNLDQQMTYMSFPVDNSAMFNNQFQSTVEPNVLEARHDTGSFTSLNSVPMDQN